MKRKESEGLFDQPVRSIFIIIILGFLALSSFFLRFTLVVPRNEKDDNHRHFTIIMNVTYRNIDEGMWFFTENERILGLFMNNSWQTVYLLNTTFPLERQEYDPDGNPIAFMVFPSFGIASGQELTYEVTYSVILKPRSLPEIWMNKSETLNDIPTELKDFYCRTEGSWQVNNSELQNLAHEIAGNKTRVLTIITEFISFIKQTINYGTLDVPRYPKETLNGGVGDCDDQANLLITLCRAVGIPAYLQIGCIYIPSKNTVKVYWDGHKTSRLSKIGWHGWAMVYIPPWGWLPVDLTYIQGNHEDPLNSIKGAALISYPTVQYLNITQSDYIKASQEIKDFIIKKDYHILVYESMEETNVVENLIADFTIPLIDV